MPEIKKTINLFHHEISVFDVPIKSATEYFSDYELEDGSKVRVKFVASAFLRVEGEYAADGKPVYVVLSAPAVNVLSSPDSLLQPPRPKPN